MKRLRKQIDEMHLVNSVTFRLQRSQVASQGRRVARNVNELRRRNPAKQSADFEARACAWRVQHDQARTLALDDSPTQKIQRRLLGRTMRMTKFRKRHTEICGCRRVGFDCRDLRKALCEHTRK